MPNDPGVCLELARIYNLIGCKDKAIVILEAAARQNPHNHVVLRDLGIAYMSTDRRKALENLQESLRLNPNQNKVKELIRLLER